MTSTAFVDGDVAARAGVSRTTLFDEREEQVALTITGDLKVLCIEDNLANLRLIERLLERYVKELGLRPPNRTWHNADVTAGF